MRKLSWVARIRTGAICAQKDAAPTSFFPATTQLPKLRERKPHKQSHLQSGSTGFHLANAALPVPRTPHFSPSSNIHTCLRAAQQRQTATKVPTRPHHKTTSSYQTTASYHPAMPPSSTTFPLQPAAPPHHHTRSDSLPPHFPPNPTPARLDQPKRRAQLQHLLSVGLER